MQNPSGRDSCYVQNAPVVNWSRGERRRREQKERKGIGDHLQLHMSQKGNISSVSRCGRAGGLAELMLTRECRSSGGCRCRCRCRPAPLFISLLHRRAGHHRRLPQPQASSPPSVSNLFSWHVPKRKTNHISVRPKAY